MRALIGVDELHARTEARYSGPVKRVSPEEEEVSPPGTCLPAFLRKQLEEPAEDLDPAPELAQVELLVWRVEPVVGKADAR